MQDGSENGGRRSAIPFILSGLSFIPLCGVVFGVVSILIGIFFRRYRALILVGLLGIGLTVVLYGGLYYFGFVQRGGIYDEMRAQMASASMNELVPWIELYRNQEGIYPTDVNSLGAFLPDAQKRYLIDPTIGIAPDSGPSWFYYEVSDDGAGYYLLGVGPDGEPFTPDDILPTVELSSVGLRIHPNSVSE